MDKPNRTQMELSVPAKDHHPLSSNHSKTIDNHTSQLGNRIQKATFAGEDH